MESRWITTIAIALFTVQMVSGMDSLSFENCENLGIPCLPKMLNIPLGKQKQFVTMMLSDGEYPPKRFAEEWNSGIKIDDKPEEIKVKNGRFINGFWVSITSMSPSVADDYALYAGNDVVVRTDHGFTFSDDNNYDSGIKTVCEDDVEAGLEHDCKMLFSLDKSETKLDISNNGIVIGSSPIIQINNLHDENQITSKATLSAVINAERWKLKEDGCCEKRCDDNGDCTCINPRYMCSFAYNEKIEEVLSLSSQKTIYRLAPKFRINSILFESTGSYYIGKLNFTAENIDSVKFSFGSKELKIDLKDYYVNFSHLPYNFMQIHSEDALDTSGSGIIVVNAAHIDISYAVSFRIASASAVCNATITTFFGSFTEACAPEILPQTILHIRTDKHLYRQNDTINLSIDASSSGHVNVQYGNFNKTIYVDKVQLMAFQARKGFNTISAVYSNPGSSRSDAKVFVQVSEQTSFHDAFSFFIVFGVLAAVLIAFKRWGETICK